MSSLSGIPPRSRVARRSIWLGLLCLLGSLAAFAGSGGSAHALVLEAFTLSASSGPPGTVVRANGSHCAPGASASASDDFVTLSSTTLPIAVSIPVDAGGNWSGTFVVPEASPPLPALISASCHTNGSPSLVTQYMPQQFTVTGDIVTEATTPPTTIPNPNNPNNPSTPTNPPNGGPTPPPPDSVILPIPVDGGNDDDSSDDNGNADRSNERTVSATPTGSNDLDTTDTTVAAEDEGLPRALAFAAPRRVATATGSDGGADLLWWLLILGALAAGAGALWFGWLTRRADREDEVGAGGLEPPTAGL